MNHQLTILTLFAMLTTGCSFGSVVEKNGHYSSQLDIESSAAMQVCQVDGDCVATAKRDGSCCPDICKATLNVFNRDNFKKLEAHQADICRDVQFVCSGPACKPLNYSQEARCKDGVCSIVKIRPKRRKSGPTRR